MKVIITGKNYAPSEKLKETIEKKFEKLDKYFSNEITGNVMTIKEKGNYKVESTINANGTIFRAEVRSGDPYDCVDRCIEKLSSQKTKKRRRSVGGRLEFIEKMIQWGVGILLETSSDGRDVNQIIGFEDN